MVEILVKSKKLALEKPRYNLSNLFKRELKKNFPDFQDIYEIVKENSDGKIWLIGSSVYTNIIKKIYGKKNIKESEDIDFDFLVERPSRKFKQSRGWETRITNYGNPYFIKEKIRIDLNYILGFCTVVSREIINPTINDYLSGTPLTVQSIAYDLNSEEIIIGKTGINAISKKLVEVNNNGVAKFEAKRRKISIERLVREKAEELGFAFSF